MKHKKLLVTLLIIFSFYIFLLLNAKKLETLATFPWVEIEIQKLIEDEDDKINFEEINIKDKEWNNINWLYLTWTRRELVYYFHGNGWPLDFFYDEIEYINQLWFSVMAYDYPGYWKSDWFPYKENIENYSSAFFEYIKNEKNIKNENLIIWWYSVWTAVATDFASKNEFNKIVLVSPFSSSYDMWAKYFFSFPPQKLFFMKNSFVTSSLVKDFEKPTLIIHWNSDFIVPFWQGKKVFENYAGDEKYFIELNNFWHNFIISEYWDVLKKIIYNFLVWDKLDFKTLFVDEEKKEELENENKNISKYIKEKNFLDLLDIKTDNSITKYVTSSVSFNNKKYIPNDLVSIDSDFLVDTKWNWKLREKALENLENMWKDFYNTFWVKLRVISAYRSYEYQAWIIAGWCSLTLCSKPGFSEHQTGLAVDIFEATTEIEFLSKSNYKKYFEWLGNNAYKYGFINSYQNWIEIDGYHNEPWHWRYVWEDLAKYLFENDMSFGEFYKKLK